MASRPLQTATLPSLRTCALKIREQGDTLRNGRRRTSWRRGRRSGGPSTLQLPPRLKGSSHLQCRHAAEGDWSASSRRSNSVRRYPWPRIQVRVGDCRKSDGRIVCEYCVYSLESGMYELVKITRKTLGSDFAARRQFSAPSRAGMSMSCSFD